jgi:crotonobetainyl-CoA:carnitine CoA-transferase CaiB-like acyl-CoA transferase
MVVRLTDADGDAIEVVGNPLKGLSLRQHAYPHRLGADTMPILRELLGLTEAEIGDLAAQGVIATG